MLKSCFDISLNKAKYFSEKFNIKNEVDMDGIFRDPEIDIVIIATLHDSLAKITLRALESGKHVLVEKPMATNMRDLDKLFKLAKKSKNLLIAAPFVILSPVFQAIHQKLKMNKIGNVSLARARYGWAGPNWGKWYYETGGGPLFDLGVYNITTLTGFLGPVKNITAKSSISMPIRNIKGKRIKVKTDDNFQILLEFKNKCLAVVTTGFTMQQYKSPAVELYGANGTIQMIGDDWDPEGYEVWDNKKSSWEFYKTQYKNWPWTSGLTHIVDCIINKKKPMINLDHSYHVNEIMIKIYESSKKKKQISVISSFKSLNFKKNIKSKKSHLDHDRNHDEI